MDDRRLGSLVRARRHQRGWRLVDLAAAAGVGATACSMLERGHAGLMSVRMVRTIGAALDLPVGWDLGWQRQDLDRLLDADHAALGGHVIGRLSRWGWHCQAEVSFNSYGDRGRIDVLAWHPGTRVLLVIELKTMIVDAQELIGRLDIKARVAPDVARRLGWRIASVVPAIIVSDTTTNRRRIASIRPLLGRYDLRGREALGWLRQPDRRASGLLMLTEVPSSAGSDARRAGRRRVRVRTQPSRSGGHVSGRSPGRRAG